MAFEQHTSSTSSETEDGSSKGQEASTTRQKKSDIPWEKRIVVVDTISKEIEIKNEDLVIKGTLYNPLNHDPTLKEN